ncbi:MAG: hypothetical protein PHD10_05200 [Bacilli bacterium]|nr:hypothetical protein [Bacilli bacterium]MDD4608504.1 hypothetical protein [Bacilli bacterium]
MIKITRIVDNKVDYDKLYQIYINDVLLDELKNGESKSFRLKVGDNHKMIIKSSDTTSNSVIFNLDDDQTIEFECGPTYKETLFSKLSKDKKYVNKKIVLVISKDFHL